MWFDPKQTKSTHLVDADFFTFFKSLTSMVFFAISWISAWSLVHSLMNFSSSVLAVPMGNTGKASALVCIQLNIHFIQPVSSGDFQPGCKKWSSLEEKLSNIKIGYLKLFLVLSSDYTREIVVAEDVLTLLPTPTIFHHYFKSSSHGQQKIKREWVGVVGRLNNRFFFPHKEQWVKSCRTILVCHK